jgi:hypothetical protein
MKGIFNHNMNQDRIEENRARISAEKKESGRWVMVAILPDGGKEYPQEGLEHDKRSDVFRDAYAMYHGSTWQYDEIKHTVVID